MICKHCGKSYCGRLNRNKFCSVACFNAFRKTSEYHHMMHKTGARINRTHDMHDAITPHFRQMKSREMAEAAERKARMAARDAAYAAQFPELVSGERRGMVSAGSHAGKFGDMNSDIMRKG